MFVVSKTLFLWFSFLCFSCIFVFIFQMGKQPQAIEMMASCINSLVSSFQLSRGSIHICQMDEQMDRHITLNHRG